MLFVMNKLRWVAYGDAGTTPKRDSFWIGYFSTTCRCPGKMSGFTVQRFCQYSTSAYEFPSAQYAATVGGEDSSAQRSGGCLRIEVTGWAWYPKRETRSRLNRQPGPVESISSPSNQLRTVNASVRQGTSARDRM